jgi:NADH-quinone oxidoreductase subunit M
LAQTGSCRTTGGAVLLGLIVFWFVLGAGWLSSLLMERSHHDSKHLANIDDPGLFLAACLILPFIKGDRAAVFALAVGVVELLCALPLFGFDLSFPGYQFEEKAEWVRSWGLTYHLGMDGISLLMVLLTVLLLPLCVLCSWSYISKRVKEFHISLMLMTSACVGVFVALDFVLFYIFWEAMLVPMFLLIAVWGGPERRYASLKFFLYTLAGSTLLLVAMVAFYIAGGTFSIPELSTKTYPFGFQCWTFLAMAIAFAIKVPMFPFHTWLPAAHVEAPPRGVMLASVPSRWGLRVPRFCLP